MGSIARNATICTHMLSHQLQMWVHAHLPSSEHQLTTADCLWSSAAWNHSCQLVSTWRHMLYRAHAVAWCINMRLISASSTPGYSNAVTQVLQQKCFTRYATTAGKLGHCHRGRTSSYKLMMTKSPGLQRSDEALPSIHSQCGMLPTVKAL